jgi:hypothetical protein
MMLHVDRSVLNSPVVKTIVAFVVLALFATYLVWPAGLPPPVEANRQRHPEGYSMIAPPDWDSKVELNSQGAQARDRLYLRPKALTNWQPALTITRRKDRIDPAALKQNDNFSDGRFQGQPALTYWGREKLHYWVYRILCQRQGQWFDITLSVHKPEDIPKSTWWPYLQSFQYDPSKATATSKPVFSTTLPADLFTPHAPTTTPAP